MKELKTTDRCLIFYFDETGHEEFADPNCPIFGLGGCAILSMYARRFIEDPWIKMKKDHWGSESIKLHANKSRNFNSEQITAIAKFFKENLFSRFYTTIRIDSSIPDEITVYKLVAESLHKRIGAVASAWPLDSIAFIFEDAERTNKLVERYFGNTSANKDNGEKVPIHKCLMKKEMGEIGLEVADFIIHSAGAQTRDHFNNVHWKARKDYECIFQSVPKQLVSSFEILSAEIQPKLD